MVYGEQKDCQLEPLDFGRLHHCAFVRIPGMGHVCDAVFGVYDISNSRLPSVEKIIPKQLDRSEPPLVRVVLFGPESTGKTTLSRQLSEHYRAPWVAEFARDFLQQKWDAQKEVCSEADLIDIAIGQIESENRAAEQADPLLICDTDVLETLAYSYWYFGPEADERLESSARQAEYDVYLLTYIDTPWTPDDLRDQPDARPELFDHFKNCLERFDRNFVILKGDPYTRFTRATELIDKLIHAAQNKR